MRCLMLISVVSAALAGCPNQCSGYGTCGAADICSCYANFQGASCCAKTGVRIHLSLFDKSWAMDSTIPHGFQECSGQGICDRVAGLCNCFAGFTGGACQRSECPNACSSNGVCKLLGDLAGVLTIPYASTNWDVGSIQTCVCDAGYFGADCSQRTCPTGDDPLTVCQSSHTNSYQELRFTLGSAVKWDPTAALQIDTRSATVIYTASDEAMDFFGTSASVDAIAARTTAPGQLHVAYIDAYNNSFPTHAVSAAFALSSPNANPAANDALEVALETLPQQKVKNVKVSSVLTSSSNGGIDYVPERRYVVTFVPDNINSNNIGVQLPLSCDSGYACTVAGCQPIVAMPFLYRYAGMDTDISVGTPLVTVGATGPGNIMFYTGNNNVDAAWSTGNFVRLHASSQPQMPFNVPVDTGVTTTNLARYDLRIIVAVIDPVNNIDDVHDLVYVRVIAGHQNISSGSEALGYPLWPSAPTFTGVWGAAIPPVLGGISTPISSAAKPWTTGLSGFTALGPIFPDANELLKIAVPGAPGTFLHLGATNIVHTDGKGRWYEILVKLPSCEVKTLDSGGAFTDIAGGALHAVDSQVENVECGNRGTCDRTSGVCKCFQGFYGLACHRVSVLV